MFSDTRMGMCCLPLCTASVKPTICGSTVERRDQVLMGLRLLVATASSTFLKRCRSMKGPYFTERGTEVSQTKKKVSTILLATTHDHAVGALVLAGQITLGRRTPRTHRMTAALGATFATPVRMIDRIHRGAK